MPPPPVPRRSDEGKPHRPRLEFNLDPARPSSRLGHVTPTRYASSNPSKGNFNSADADMAAEHIENIERNIKDIKRESAALRDEKTILQNQIKQVDDQMEQVKANFRKSTGKEPSHQEVLQEWVRLRQANAGFGAPQTLRKDSVIDKKDFGPMGGKLVHDEKIPAGTNSTFAEDIKIYKAPWRYDERCEVPELRDENVRKRPRHEYYAAKESDTSTNSAVRLLSPGNTQGLKIRPQWEKHPDKYWELQKTRVESMSRKRKQKRSENSQKGLPNEGAVAHLRSEHSVLPVQQHEQAVNALVAKIEESARISSESTPVFDDYPDDITPYLPKFSRPSAEPAVVPGALSLSPSRLPASPSQPEYSEQPSKYTGRVVKPGAPLISSSGSPRSVAIPLLPDSDDDIPIWDPDEQPTDPAAPRIRDDMDIDGDISV